MYSGVQICKTLMPNMKCIRLRKYNHGQGDPFNELFREHIPGHRISADASIEMMKALVLRYEEVDASYILHCYVNNRGRDPAFHDPFRINIEYPEPGVLRKYCGINVQAWLDTVIAPEQFRKP